MRINIRIEGEIEEMFQKALDKDMFLTKTALVKKALYSFLSESRSKPLKGDFTKDEFERFWAAWPKSERKVNKKGCEAKFFKIKGVNFEDLILSLEAQKKLDSWTSGFEPMPLTWLNQERWIFEQKKEWYEK